jgi:hypothetical protein
MGDKRFLLTFILPHQSVYLNYFELTVFEGSSSWGMRWAGTPKTGIRGFH